MLGGFIVGLILGFIFGACITFIVIFFNCLAAKLETHNLINKEWVKRDN